MSTEKQKAATSIKRLAAELIAEMTKAEELGLTVKVHQPDARIMPTPKKLEVEVWEKVSY